MHTHSMQSYESYSPHPLDSQYLQLRTQIQNSLFFKRCSNHTHIRLSQWLHNLDLIITNPTWRKNRNNYAKLLQLVCQCETVVEPFNKMPPKDIPTLSKHHINQVIDAVQRAVKAHKQQIQANTVTPIKESKVKPAQYWSMVQKHQQSRVQQRQIQSMMEMGKTKFNQSTYSGAGSDIKSKLKLKSNKENISQSTIYQTLQTQARSPTKKPPQQQQQLNLIKPLVYFEKKKRLNTQELSMSSINFFQYSQEESKLMGFDGQKQNNQNELNKISNQAQGSQDDSLQYDFQALLSERCPELMNVPLKTYFGWKKQETSKQKEPVASNKKVVIKKIDFPLKRMKSDSTTQNKENILFPSCNKQKGLIDGDNKQNLLFEKDKIKQKQVFDAGKLQMSCQIYQPLNELQNLCLLSQEPGQSWRNVQHDKILGQQFQTIN